MLSAALDEGVEGDLIDVEEVALLLISLEKELDDLDGFLYLIALNAAVEKNIEEHFPAFETNDRSLDNFTRVVEEAVV